MANPGNQDQSRHNSDALRTIEKANSLIKGDGETTITALNEGNKLITDRKSWYAWRTERKRLNFVPEYVNGKTTGSHD